MINIIVAISDNYVIGREGDMPWHISADMRFFKEKTFGNTVIMGRKTWLSIGAKPLAGRRNIVVSSCDTFNPQGAEVARSLDNALKMSENDVEVFIMGGGQIYRQAINFADRLYITRIHAMVNDADTFFPLIYSNDWKITERSEVMTDEKSGLSYQFLTYDRN